MFEIKVQFSVLFLYPVKDGDWDLSFLTSRFKLKLKEISNHLVYGWYDAFEEGVKRLSLKTIVNLGS